MEVNLLSKTVNSMINQRLLDTHTSFLARVISIELNKMTVRPLFAYKAYGGKAAAASVINAVPVLFPFKYVYYVDEETEELIKIEQEKVREGDTVYCGVCDRDITEAKKGADFQTSPRHHDLSDSIVVMGLSEVVYAKGEEE